MTNYREKLTITYRDNNRRQGKFQKEKKKGFKKPIESSVIIFERPFFFFFFFISVKYLFPMIL